MTRILVLGHSHYEWCERCKTDKIERTADLTAACISERLVIMGSPGQIQHWTKVENVFLGASAEIEFRRQFW